MELKECNEERVINLKDFLFCFIHSWRKIILLAIIFALLLGSYKFSKGINELNNINMKTSQEKTYQTSFSTYNLNKTALESEIENIAEKIKVQKYYNENSIQMKIDPYDEQFVNISYYVETNYKIMPELTYQNTDISDMVIQSYVTLAQSGKMYQYIQDNLSSPIDIKYLKEIVKSWADDDSHMINIHVIHYDKKICEEIYQLILEYFDDSKRHVTDAVGEHIITMVGSAIQSQVDLDLENTQNYNNQLVSDYEAKLLEKHIALSALSEPIKIEYSINQVIKSTVKYFVIGVVLGMILATFCIMLVNLLNDKLINIEKFRECYNIRLIGVISNPTKKKAFNFIDRWLNKLVGVVDNVDENEQIKIICANLKAILLNRNIENTKTMLTGTIDISKINDICTKISKELSDSRIEFKTGNNINYSSNTINDIQEYDSIVIIEEINCSSNKEISKQIINIKNFNKKIIGAIII